MANITVALYQSDQSIKHISEVENGIGCGCVCLECNMLLVAANGGKIQEHHFRHSSDSDCDGSPETGLHLLAKRVIRESNVIQINEDIQFNYTKVIEEKFIDSIKPDVQLFNEDKSWIVEVAVTHKVEDNKLQKIKSLKINALEIDLQNVNRNIELEDLKEIVLSNLDSRQILYSNQKSTKPQSKGCLLALIFLTIIAFFGFNRKR